MVNRASPEVLQDSDVVSTTEPKRGKQETARVQAVRPSPDSSANRPDPRTVSLSTADQIGEFLICAEIVHENRWREAVAKVGKNNLHLLLAELALPVDAEDDFSSTNLLRERRLTRYQVEQIVSGKLSALVLGPYLLRKRLGRGGMAEVYQAYNRELDRIEAVKVLRTDKPRGNLDMAALARREARVLASLVHPNITTIFRADTASNGATYLAMEYIPGETVEAKVSRLTKGGEYMPIREAVRIVLEASFALGYAHSKHVIHRDVKPGNVMVTPDGHVKVLDVGIAALFAPDKEESFGKGTPKEFSTLAGFGTPHYMAPEQWKDNETTESVDVYGLAATLFHMLVGRPPFGEKDLEILLASKKQGAVNPATLRREIPKALGQVVQKGLAGDPAERYPSMEAFAAALEPFFEDKSKAVRTDDIPWMGVVGVMTLAVIAIRMEKGVPRGAPAERPATVVIEKQVPVPVPAKPTEFNWKGKYFKSVMDAAAYVEKEGDLAAAAGLFLEAATAAPEFAESHRRKAVDLLEAFVAAKVKDNPKQALESAGWALSLAPTSARLIELKGQANERLGRFDEAARQFELAAQTAPAQAKRLNGASAGALRRLADEQAGQKQFKQAEQTLQAAARRHPSRAAEMEAARQEVLIRWAAAAVEAGDPSARSIIAEANKAAPNRAEPLKLQAELLEKSNDWKAAADVWIAWGRIAKDEGKGSIEAADCWLQWGREAVEKGDHQAAVERLERAKTLGASDGGLASMISTSRNHLGFALHRKGDDAAAVAEYTRALDAAPKSAVTYRNRGYSHLKLKKFKEAERDYSTAIEIDRGNALAFRMRGSIRLLNSPDKDWKAILDDFREAARLDADDARTNYYLAFVYANCPDKNHRDARKAVFHADKACKATNYDDWEHLAMLAAAHADAGQLDEAIARIDQAEQRAPAKNKADLKALAESYRGRK
jgi:tetratricopeptide (TPR) repeat protein/tRNA A-37 threonylcarbamoyl transferase component Bud32